MRALTLETCLPLLMILVHTEAWFISWPEWGRCPYMDVSNKFNPKQYFDGTWYLRKAYNNEFLDGRGRCSFSKYSNDKTSGLTKVKFQHWSIWKNDWASENATLSRAESDAKFLLKFHDKFGFLDETLPYWIVEVDAKYEKYSIAYSCENVFLFFHQYSSWVMTRDPSSDIKYIDERLRYHTLDPSLFVEIDQSRCPPESA
ncbi:apolipoprotein D-like [Macrosteles quadrilineatus]|uniref:apolipoprotein D-like n=1 Tax=Macrosteles quadrilineatus TaxID=74068 RepID=UPI0023E30442|nr:apolipoprotein D-like [Macrosteles quadrilineatus]